MSALASLHFNGVTKEEKERREKGGYQRRSREEIPEKRKNTGEYTNRGVTVQYAVKEVIERQTGAAVT